MTVPVVLVFAALLALLSRAVRRWEAERAEQAHAAERHSAT